MNEVITVAIRQWTPDARDPAVVLDQVETQSQGYLHFLYTHINSTMRSLLHGPPKRIVVFVDQRLEDVTAQPLVDYLHDADVDEPLIVSPAFALAGEQPEPWYEPINPYCWAARGQTLARMALTWTQHLQFGHEALMINRCKVNDIEMVCRPDAVADIGTGPATAVTNDLYYRQLEDAATVASVLGVGGPSA